MDKKPTTGVPSDINEKKHINTSDIEDDPPNSREKSVNNIQEQDKPAGSGNNLSQTAVVESKNAVTLATEAATIAINTSSPARQRRDALDGLFTHDILDVLNASTRIYSQRFGHTSQMYESTFADDMNIINLYDSARVVTDSSCHYKYIEDYDVVDRYPRWDRDTTDCSSIIAEESEDEDVLTIECDEPQHLKQNGDNKDAEQN